MCGCVWVVYIFISYRKLFAVFSCLYWIHTECITQFNKTDTFGRLDICMLAPIFISTFNGKMFHSHTQLLNERTKYNKYLRIVPLVRCQWWYDFGFSYTHFAPTHRFSTFELLPRLEYILSFLSYQRRHLISNYTYFLVYFFGNTRRYCPFSPSSTPPPQTKLFSSNYFSFSVENM